MKANEFFKAMGINAVKQFLENDNIRTKEMHDDLKRLVESHELVEWHGGLKYAKSYFERNSKEYPNAKGWDELAEAIADVESCMGVSSETN